MNIAAIINYFLIGATSLYCLSFLMKLINKKSKLVKATFFGAIIIHSTSQIMRGWIGGIFIPNAVFEGVYLIPLVIALLLLLLFNKVTEVERNSFFILIIFLSIIAIIYPTGILPQTPKKLTLLASGFFFFEGIGYALFIVGGVLASLRLFNQNTSDISNNIIISGFIFYSIAQVVGALWCLFGWGFLFHWGQRHLLSAAVWMFYGAIIHMRYLNFKSPKRKDQFVILGMLLVLITSYSLYIHEASYIRLGN